MATSLTAFAVDAPKKPSRAEAEAGAAKWLDSLDKEGLVLNEQVKKDGFVVTHAHGASGPVTHLNYQKPGWSVSFAIHGTVSADTPLKTLQDQLWFVTLDRVPTPDLDLPGWEVRPLTPTSSVEKGCEVLEYRDGKIKVRVRTRFFALNGRDSAVLVPADAPAPHDSYFKIRKGFPLDLVIEAPVEFK
jgi:hypothetical protein